jgi:hypothetical protein
MSDGERFSNYAMLLAEMRLLAEAVVFVGTFSSNVGRLVQVGVCSRESSAGGRLGQAGTGQHCFSGLIGCGV